MTWKEFEKELDALATMVDSPVGCIVPIVRGGLVPGRLLASKLHIKEMYALTVKKSKGKNRVETSISVDLTNQRILLVEDMLETGGSMIAAKEYLESKGAVVKTACLYTMPQTKITPDYSLRQITTVVSFPWE